jgi:hypothetical protein
MLARTVRKRARSGTYLEKKHFGLGRRSKRVVYTGALGLLLTCLGCTLPADCARRLLCKAALLNALCRRRCGASPWVPIELYSESCKKRVACANLIFYVCACASANWIGSCEHRAIVRCDRQIRSSRHRRTRILLVVC